MIYTGIYIDKEGSYRTSVCVSSLNDRAAAWTEIAATLTEDDKLIMLSPGWFESNRVHHLCGCSSVVRAVALYAIGRRFKSCLPYQTLTTNLFGENTHEYRTIHNL